MRGIWIGLALSLPLWGLLAVSIYFLLWRFVWENTPC